MASDKKYLEKVITKKQTPKCVSIFPAIQLREGVSSSKFVFTPTFIFCSPICLKNCGATFFVKIYFSFREMTFLVRSLKYVNFYRKYYPSCMTSCHEYT